ncbi:MAG: hydroxyacylglutathione hydrolase [Alphaproteobacteria bacterium]|nr:hydroxyacylglutathione hydrolase [Alphaproteobacteria bacterium]
MNPTFFDVNESSRTMSFTIEILPALSNNYTFLLSDPDLGLATVIDPSDGPQVATALKKRDLYLALILNTHHHPDHTGGNEFLQQEFGAPVIGPLEEKNLIPGISRGVTRNDIITFSTLRGQVLPTHGHTDGHISFYFPQIKALFSGDVLFPLGCGRLIEGNSAQMWESLILIRNLPDDTLIYASHELAEENVSFALSVDKKNFELQKRAATLLAQRKAGKPSVPMILGDEKRFNPFLRPDNADFRKVLATAGIAPEDADPAAVFGLLRSAKDHFGQNGL